MGFRNYKQNVEAELAAMIFALIATGICAAGFLWAIVFVARWLIA